MAKKSLSQELLGEVRPSSLRAATVGAFLSFFVYAGAVFTFEPIAASYFGNDSVILYAQFAGSEEDADMQQAQDQAAAEQQIIDQQRAAQAYSDQQTEADRQRYQNETPREGDTRYVNGTVEIYTGGTWTCRYPCKEDDSTKKPQGF